MATDFGFPFYFLIFISMIRLMDHHEREKKRSIANTVQCFVINVCFFFSHLHVHSMALNCAHSLMRFKSPIKFQINKDFRKLLFFLFLRRVSEITLVFLFISKISHIGDSIDVELSMEVVALVLDDSRRKAADVFFKCFSGLVICL